MGQDLEGTHTHTHTHTYHMCLGGVEGMEGLWSCVRYFITSFEWEVTWQRVQKFPLWKKCGGLRKRKKREKWPPVTIHTHIHIYLY